MRLSPLQPLLPFRYSPLQLLPFGRGDGRPEREPQPWSLYRHAQGVQRDGRDLRGGVSFLLKNVRFTQLQSFASHRLSIVVSWLRELVALLKLCSQFCTERQWAALQQEVQQPCQAHILYESAAEIAQRKNQFALATDFFFKQVPAGGSGGKMRLLPHFWNAYLF